MPAASCATCSLVSLWFTPAELEDAINASKRVPNMVLSAHVHN
jgi:hypothetical protein